MAEEAICLTLKGAEDVLITDSEKVLISDLGVMVLCWVLLCFLDLYRDMDYIFFMGVWERKGAVYGLCNGREQEREKERKES